MSLPTHRRWFFVWRSICISLTALCLTLFFIELPARYVEFMALAQLVPHGSNVLPGIETLQITDVKARHLVTFS